MSELKTIKEWQKQQIGEIIGYYTKSVWYFETALEKLILVILCLLGFWKIAGWIF